MNFHEFSRHFADAIDRATARRCQVRRFERVSGGSISEAYRVITDDARYFVKCGHAEGLAAITAEADGLAALSACTQIRVPRVLACEHVGDTPCLILEHIELHPLTEGSKTRRAGSALAALHRLVDTSFGWFRDNYVGRTLQDNTRHAAWSDFFLHRRLLPQLDLADRLGRSPRMARAGFRLAEQISAFFTDHHPQASLLHGDLWHGNAALDASGTLTLFDPAVYSGDRETDIAMCELFGGFPRDFLDGYNDVWPLEAGYPSRRPLYQLYHVLNHLNLFGNSYLRQAEQLIEQLRADTGG